jgi:hypothetical protein
MGITPPATKFTVPNEILGIAMEGYAGGRSETRTRHAEVPVVPVDFTSEYPTTCALLELMEILTAGSLTFEDATKDVQRMLDTITLDRCFNSKLWPRFRFFALLKPDGDVLPVRTIYNGTTQMSSENSARPQPKRSTLAQTPADDAYGCHHSERFETPAPLGRISPIQLLSASHSGQLWVPGKRRSRLLHTSYAV